MVGVPANYINRVIREDNGNVIIYQPFDLEYELACLKSEAEGMEKAARLGVPYIAGGAAGNWTFTDAARTDCFNGTYDWDLDSFKMALFLSASNLGAATTTYATVTSEHANANGYTTGGIACTIALSGTTTLTVDSTTNPVWTAAGGSIIARSGGLYKVAGRLPCYFLLDSTPADVTVTAGNTLTCTIHASGIFTVA